MRRRPATPKPCRPGWRQSLATPGPPWRAIRAAAMAYTARDEAGLSPVSLSSLRLDPEPLPGILPEGGDGAP